MGLASMPYASLPWIMSSDTATMAQESLSSVANALIGGSRVKSD